MSIVLLSRKNCCRLEHSGSRSLQHRTMSTELKVLIAAACYNTTVFIVLDLPGINCISPQTMCIVRQQVVHCSCKIVRKRVSGNFLLAAP